MRGFLFKNDCALAPLISSNDLNHLSHAVKLFIGFATSLKKTEVLSQPESGMTIHEPKITIEETKLNNVEALPVQETPCGWRRFLSNSKARASFGKLQARCLGCLCVHTTVRTASSQNSHGHQINAWVVNVNTEKRTAKVTGQSPFSAFGRPYTLLSWEDRVSSIKLLCKEEMTGIGVFFSQGTVSLVWPRHSY